MKKVVIAIVFTLLSIDVLAWTNQECKQSQIEEGKAVLQDISYNLEYADNYMDMGGNFQEGYMRIRFSNIPSGYFALIKTIEGELLLDSNEKFGHISGGVHRIELYSDQCDTVLKSFEFMVPHHKQFCGENGIKCEEDPWFDGTYENNPSNQNRKPKSKLSIALIVVLVILVSMIVAFIIYTIRRRKKRAEEF